MFLIAHIVRWKERRATKNYFSVEIRQNFVTGGELNRHFTEKSVAKAKIPRIFPIFPKFFPALKICQLCVWVASHEGKFSREKTS